MNTLLVPDTIVSMFDFAHPVWEIKCSIVPYAQDQNGIPNEYVQSKGQLDRTTLGPFSLEDSMTANHPSY